MAECHKDRRLRNRRVVQQLLGTGAPTILSETFDVLETAGVITFMALKERTVARHD
jgi:hypothetical protein